MQTERRTKRIYSFFIPRCSLSYEKIMQTEDNTRIAKIRIAIPNLFVFIVEVQLILCKDNANRAENKNFKDKN